MLATLSRTPTLPPQPSIFASRLPLPRPGGDNPEGLFDTKPTELSELCEPLFRFMCQLSRAGKAGAHDFASVRREVNGLLRDARNRAIAIGSLMAAQFEKVELVLVSFVDFTIATSSLPFAREWGERRLAYDQRPPCMTGDQEFFHQLDRTLIDPSDAATERLVVFFHCMGLGFSGMYLGRPEAAPLLRRKMQECATRLRDRLDPHDAAICPDAYFADTREAHVRFRMLAWGIGIAFVGMIVTLYIANLLSFKEGAERLRQTAAQAIRHAEAAQSTSNKP